MTSVTLGGVTGGTFGLANGISTAAANQTAHDVFDDGLDKITAGLLSGNVELWINILIAIPEVMSRT